MGNRSNAPQGPGSRGTRLAERKEATEGFQKELQKERLARAEKTARLKALRLAKEAADREAAASVPPAPVKKRAHVKRVGSSGKLS